MKARLGGAETIIDIFARISAGRYRSPMRPARSITEQVYRQLKTELLKCQLRPGEHLRTKELSIRFSVSLSVVREALSRLTAEGLVDSDPQRGFRAAPLSSADLLALTEAGIEIEALCIRKALKNGDAAWEQRVRNGLDRVSTASSAIDSAGRINETFLMHHHAFHDALISACSNTWLLRMRYSCHLQAERYRQICIPLQPDLDKIYIGYDEIAEAALNRDLTTTVRLVSEQFERNALRFVATFQDGGAAQFWSRPETADAEIPAPVGL
jgi:DNA-binding GntR family transcriptional regulator